MKVSDTTSNSAKHRVALEDNGRVLVINSGHTDNLGDQAIALEESVA